MPGKTRRQRCAVMMYAPGGSAGWTAIQARHSFRHAPLSRLYPRL